MRNIRLYNVVLCLLTGLLVLGAVPALAQEMTPAGAVSLDAPSAGLASPDDVSHGTSESHPPHNLDMMPPTGVILENTDHQIRHTEHHAPSGLPQMDVSWFPSQVFWMFSTFVFLYVVFSSKVLPDISSTLEKRHNKIQEDLDHAQRLRDTAAKVQKDYENLLYSAQLKAAEFFQNAEEETKKKTTKKMHSFILRAEKEIKKREEDLQDAKTSALKDIPNFTAEAAHLAAQKIIDVTTDMDQVKAIVTDLTKKVA